MIVVKCRCYKNGKRNASYKLETGLFTCVRYCVFQNDNPSTWVPSSGRGRKTRRPNQVNVMGEERWLCCGGLKIAVFPTFYQQAHCCDVWIQLLSCHMSDSSEYCSKSVAIDSLVLRDDLSCTIPQIFKKMMSMLFVALRTLLFILSHSWNAFSVLMRFVVHNPTSILDILFQSWCSFHCKYCCLVSVCNRTPKSHTQWWPSTWMLDHPGLADKDLDRVRRVLLLSLIHI